MSDCGRTDCTLISTLKLRKVRFRRVWSTLVNVGPQIKFLAEKLDSDWPCAPPPPPGVQHPCDGKGQVGEERSGRFPHRSLLPAPPPEQRPRPPGRTPASTSHEKGGLSGLSPLGLLGVPGGAWRLPGPRRCFWSPTGLKARLGCGELAGGARLSGSPTEFQAQSGPPTSDQKPGRRYPAA